MKQYDVLAVPPTPALIWQTTYDIDIDIETDKMAAVKISAEEFLKLPADAQKTESGNAPIPYRYAFLKPPHGTSYRETDFVAFNDILFPNKDDIEVYRWNDDFSNYFDAGKEWWGTALWSVRDLKTGMVVIIGASETD